MHYWFLIKISNNESSSNFRGGSRRIVEHDALNRGFEEMSVPAENDNVEYTQVALETTLAEKSKYQKESEKSIKELEDFDSSISPITTLYF